MPSIAQAVEENILGKKRRRDEAGQTRLRVSESYLDHHHHHSLADVPYLFDDQLTAGDEPSSLRRRIITPKPLIPGTGANKRQRIIVPSPFLHSPTEITHDSYFTLSPSATSPHRSQPSTPYTPPSTTPLESSSVAAQSKAVQKLDLSPCHICHRKPTSKHELEAFAGCEGCGKRTCWICIRKCEGWRFSERVDPERGFGQHADVTFALEDETGREKGGTGRRGDAIGSGDMSDNVLSMDEVSEHRDMVCSRCCVERGSEGDVWCLGCLRAAGSG